MQRKRLIIGQLSQSSRSDPIVYTVDSCDANVRRMTVIVGNTVEAMIKIRV